ncbi:MAG TPA: nitrous oxide-stimulated promoter family protein [Syntrophales bacterium]|nr:nitrous oxide-stimulated promoter family protein [Syntrophales bacterium]
MRREIRTGRLMIGMFCRRHHGGEALCDECRELSSYAEDKTRRCRFGAEKPACSDCPVHCYQPAMREKIRAVMRYAGPRMIWSHPILALRHLLDRKP